VVVSKALQNYISDSNSRIQKAVRHKHIQIYQKVYILYEAATIPENRLAM
jgi:hypothetical protein